MKTEQARLLGLAWTALVATALMCTGVLLGWMRTLPTRWGSYVGGFEARASEPCAHAATLTCRVSAVKSHLVFRGDYAWLRASVYRRSTSRAGGPMIVQYPEWRLQPCWETTALA